ncbi:hypothetical protein WJX73_000590 [Symbiochloris irregularis]|uniref:Protein FAM33A n=1 Tax=Symbiochloris irregularis TaxID=706552 RepID=A0AAW1PE47_9CHLO
MVSLVESADQLVLSLEHGEAELRSLRHRLEAEFAERFERKTANPCLIVHRLHNLQRELTSLKDNYAQLTAAKAELIAETNRTIKHTTDLLHELENKAGHQHEADSNSAWMIAAQHSASDTVQLQ